MPEGLLVIEDAFLLRGRGVAVSSPELPLEKATGRPFPVVLRLPDGSERHSEGLVEVAHTWRPAYRAWGALLLRGLTREDVPNGTEVWSA